MTRLTDPGTMAGTPPYMAPEQLLGKPTSARTDQFAFGVLFYELLTGRHPFGSGPLPTTIARVLSADLDPAADIGPDLWAVIHRATQKQPEDRFATTGELVDCIDPWHQLEPSWQPLATLGTPESRPEAGGNATS